MTRSSLPSGVDHPAEGGIDETARPAGDELQDGLGPLPREEALGDLVDGPQTGLLAPAVARIAHEGADHAATAR